MIRVIFPILCVAASLFIAGCGGKAKDMNEITSCLRKAKLTVEVLPKKKEIKSGVFATTDLAKVDSSKFTFALAAFVTTEKAVKKFQKESKEFSKTAGVDRKLDFETGVDGKYVWVAGGAKNTKDFKDARTCVKA